MKEEYKLYCGDCLEVMKDIKDKSIDMILVDLPYGKTQNSKDIVIPFEPLWKQYERIIKDNGCIALFAQGLFTVDLVNSNRKLFRYFLVWNKELSSSFLNSNRMPLRIHEDICIFYKKLCTYNPQFTEGAPLHGKGNKVFSDNYELKNSNYGNFKISSDIRKGSTQKFPTSILNFKKPHPSVALHPTEKSIPLLEYLIKTYSNEGETILDSCFGSCTTGVAAINTHRNFIGIEKDENYFKIGKERIFKISSLFV